MADKYLSVCWEPASDVRLFYFLSILGPFTWAADFYCSAKWPCLGNRETMICINPYERWCNQTRLDFVRGSKDFRGSSITFNKDLKSTLTSALRHKDPRFRIWALETQGGQSKSMILQGQASAQSDGHTDWVQRTDLEPREPDSSSFSSLSGSRVSVHVILLVFPSATYVCLFLTKDSG